MANKSNDTLAVDRESISAFDGYANIIANELDTKKANMALTVTSYLLSDENLRGGDTKDFKESVQKIQEIVGELTGKMADVKKYTGLMLSVLGATATTKLTSIKEARAAITSVKMKLQDTANR